MADALDPNRFHILSRKQRWIIFSIILVFALIVIPVAGYFYYKFAVYRPSSLDRELSFEIKSGESLTDISQRLYDSQLVNSKFLFEFYLLINDLDDRMQAGNYVITAGSSIVDLGEQFQHGVNDTRITFLEGWRLEEFARHAAEKLPKISYRSFMEAAQGMEGELFPDTYYVSNEIQEDELVTILHDTFLSKTNDILSPQGLEKSGISRSDAIILASIVERESNNYADRKVVAGILYKRMREGIRLDADATVQYVVANTRVCPDGSDPCVLDVADLADFSWWPKELTLSDLALDSPYNTRLHPGLPPTPISSVSLNTLDAVVNMEPTSYYYYLNDASGKTHFSETLEEHNLKVERYLSL